MLRGRTAQLAAIDDVIRRSVAGAGATVVFVGPPGIGKTALLDAAAERAATECAVVRMTGFESERDLPWAGLTQVPGLLAASTVEHETLVRSTRDPSSRLVVFLAVLQHLAQRADARPLCIVLDDAQWLDSESLDCLRFVARRIDASPIALIGARRDDPIEAFPNEVGLDPLSLADSELVLDELRKLVPQTRAQLARAADGNPLALAEFARALTDAQCDGSAPLPDPLPAGAALEKAFSTRFAVLPDDARRAVLALAVGGVVDLAALEVAEEAGLVELNVDGPRFRHPLIRSAAYASADLAERRAAHAAAADATDDAHAAAWHRAAALTGPSLQVADALVSAAHAALRRGAFRSAANAFVRASEVHPDPAAALGMLVRAADAALDGGDPLNAGLLLDATATDGATDIAWRRTRLRLDLHTSNPPDASQRLLELAEEVLAVDPDAAWRLLLDTITRFIAAARPFDAAPLVARFAELTPPAPEFGVFTEIAEGALQCISGERDKGAARLVGYEPLLELDDPPITHLSSLVGSMLGFAGAPNAVEVIERFYEVAVSSNHLTAIPFLHTGRALSLYRTDAAGAVAAAIVGLDAAEELGLPPILMEGTLGTLVATAAQVGDRQIVERYVPRLGAGAPLGTTPDVNVRSAMGLIALLENRHEDTLTELMPLWEWEGDEFKVPLIYYHDVGEAASRLGNTELANAAIAKLNALHEVFPGAWVRGVLRRLEAMALDADACGPAYAESVDLLLQTNLAFGAARTELLWGEHLRRARRPAAARDVLRAALTRFESLGATGWAARAQRELVAAGDAPSGAADRASAALSPQQLEVARWVVAGLTYRDIAARLFLSPRTVESHVSAIYRRLGVRNRAELAARAQQDPTLVAS